MGSTEVDLGNVGEGGVNMIKIHCMYILNSRRIKMVF